MSLKPTGATRDPVLGEENAGCLILSLGMQMQDQKFMAIFSCISDLEVSLGHMTPQLEEPN